MIYDPPTNKLISHSFILLNFFSSTPARLLSAKTGPNQTIDVL